MNSSGEACFLLFMMLWMRAAFEQKLGHCSQKCAHVCNYHQYGEDQLEEDPSFYFKDHNKGLCQQDKRVEGQAHWMEVHRDKSSGIDDAQNKNDKVAQEGCEGCTVYTEYRDKEEV